MLEYKIFTLIGKKVWTLFALFYILLVGIKIWKDLIISSGTDQRVCIFKWCTTSGLDVTLASQCSSVVADVQGIEVWQQSE